MDAIDQARKAKDTAAQLLTQGRPDAALREYERALSLFPDDDASRRKVAELLARLGRKAEAIAAYQQLAGRHASAGQLAQAIAVAKLILQLDPGHTETQETIARLYARRTAAAGSWLEKIPASMAGALDIRHLARPAPKPAAPASKFTELEVEIELDTSALPKAPLFSELPREVFLALLAELEIATVPSGTAIVSEGAPGRSMFVLAQGRVKVVRGLGTQQEKTVDAMEEGTFFGEIALLSEAPRLASVVADGECVVLELRRELLSDLAMKHEALEPVLQHFYRERLLANLLRSCPLFTPFDEPARRALADRFALRRVPAGEVLLREGDAASTLFVLLRGCCEVFHQDAKGATHLYPPLTEGAILGEIALLQEGIASASVRAAGECLLLALDPETFRSQVLSNPAVRQTLEQLRAARLKRTADLLLKLGSDYAAWV